jgi:hypothetical protein
VRGSGFSPLTAGDSHEPSHPPVSDTLQTLGDGVLHRALSGGTARVNPETRFSPSAWFFVSLRLPIQAIPPCGAFGSGAVMRGRISAAWGLLNTKMFQMSICIMFVLYNISRCPTGRINSSGEKREGESDQGICLTQWQRMGITSRATWSGAVRQC